MTITLEIKPELEAELTRQATAQGRPIEAYVAGLLEDAAHRATVLDPKRVAVIDACQRLKTFGIRHGLSLGDSTIREMRDEARP